MTVIPRRLSPPEHRAVKHLLERSALGSCAGTQGRIHLSPDGDLTLQRLDDWPFSSGEEVLVDVLRFLIGTATRWPDLAKVDEHQQLIVRESMRLLVREPVA
jgi:hypothetical protein